MKTSVKTTLLLGLCAASGLLFWLWSEREELALPVVKVELETEVAVPAEIQSNPVAEPRAVVKTLCGIIGDGNSGTRLDAAHALPSDLNTKEYDLILKNILLASQPEGMYYRAWHAVFNDALNALVRGQTVRIDALPSHLRAIMKDAKRNLVIRDYALQHLLAYAEFRMETSERLALINSIWPEVQAGGHTLPGTYLLALLHTPSREGWPTKAETAERAWKLLQDDQTHILSQITALQTCGQLGHQPALAMALEIAADTKAHMSLRTAAIATIGNLGSATEQTYLKDLNKKIPKRLQFAVSAALRKLEKANETI